MIKFDDISCAQPAKARRDPLIYPSVRFGSFAADALCFSSDLCPLLLQEPTHAGAAGMSAKCHKRTHALQHDWRKKERPPMRRSLRNPSRCVDHLRCIVRNRGARHYSAFKKLTRSVFCWSVKPIPNR